MATPIPDGGALLNCLTSRLSEERSVIENFHRLLVVDIQAQLDSLSRAIPVVNGDPGAISAPTSAPPALQPGNADLLHITPAANGVAVPHSSFASATAPGSKPATAANGSEGQRPDDDLQHWAKHSHTGDSTFAKITEGKGQDAEGQRFVTKLVKGKRFEWFFGIMILVHIVIMTLETQYRGLGVGHEIGYPYHGRPKEEVWPGINTMFDVLDIIFGILYTIEIILKIVGLNRHFIDGWNLLDLLVVLMWYLDTLAGNIKLPVDTMLLRLLRLAKLLRLIKVFKAMRGFEQLFLMLTALRGSLHILLWVSVLLFSGLLAFALLLNQTLVAYYIEDSQHPLENRRECYQYFGTFSRSLFSMFEMTLGNWTPIARFLLENVSEFFCVFSIMFKLTMGFSVIAVLNGCFIKETFKLADQDDTLMILQKDKERHLHFEKMMKLLDVADQTGSGTLTRQEFIDVCQDPEVDIWLGAQGLRVTDAGTIFDLIDTGTGQISKGELVMGARKLQGTARSLDVAKNQTKIEDLMRTMTEIEARQTSDILMMLNDVSRREIKEPASAASGAGLFDHMQCHKELMDHITNHVSDLKAVHEQSNVKDELARLSQDLASLKSCLAPQGVSTPMPLTTPPAAARGQQISQPKVIFGCS